MHIKIVGDIIPHHQVVASCCTGKDSYDFTNIFKYIKEDLKSDFTICNFESAFASNLPFRGHIHLYPQFSDIKEYKYIENWRKALILINSPEQFIQECINIFDGFCLANNHTYDGGHAGFKELVDYLNSKNKNIFGIKHQRNIIKLKDITIGVYNYTNFTKSIKLDSALPQINLNINDAELKYLRKVCDILIIIPHWGVEYNNSLNFVKFDINKLITNYSPDLIIGGHSHILSNTIEYISNTPVISSLGNFFSGQMLPKTNIGGICSITIDETTKKISHINIIETKCFNAGELEKSFIVRIK